MSEPLVKPLSVDDCMQPHRQSQAHQPSVATLPAMDESAKAGAAVRRQSQARRPHVRAAVDWRADPDFEGYDEALLRVQHAQPVMNVCTLGDVSHGKSTLMHALSGERTARSWDEQRRNMTIKLGYTSCKIWKCYACAGPAFPSPPCAYFSTSSDIMGEHIMAEVVEEGKFQHEEKKKRKRKKKRRGGKSKAILQCPRCEGGAEDIVLVRHVAFVDCPGHAKLVGTMISAACVVDGALLVVDASKPCPGEMAEQHARAAALLGVLHPPHGGGAGVEPTEEEDGKQQKKEKAVGAAPPRARLVVAQNKVDLVDAQRACQQHEEITAFLASVGLTQRTTPIVPVCAQQGLNVDALCCHLVRQIPVPRRDVHAPLRLQVIRSFDVNKPHVVEDVMSLRGGVVGGAITQGTLTVGDEVEIRPGLVTRQGRVMPLRSTVVSLRCGTQSLRRAFPGANVGVELKVDPSLTKANRLVGAVLTKVPREQPDALPQDPRGVPPSLQAAPPVWRECKLTYVAVPPPRGAAFKPFERGEEVRLNVGANNLTATLVAAGPLRSPLDPTGPAERALHVRVRAPVCASIGERVAVTRLATTGVWRLALGGVVRRVKRLPLHDIGAPQAAKDQAD